MMSAPKPKGYALIFTLMSLLAMTMIATSYVAQTSHSLVASKLMAGAMVSQANAQLGLQRGILMVRQNSFSTNGNSIVINSTDTCTPDVADYEIATTANCLNHVFCHPGDCASSSVLAPVVTSSNGTGIAGGMQYRIMVYKSPALGTPLNRYIIRAIGYYGTSRTSPNFMSTVLEAEMDVGVAANGVGGLGGAVEESYGG